MGQKIHPTGFRLAVNRDWSSKWYANSKHFPTILNEDIKVRAYLKKFAPGSSIHFLQPKGLAKEPGSA